MEEGLVEVNERIAETKKRIQLSEGQRKAHFEECDAEKKRNGEKIGALKREVKEMYAALAEPLGCKEWILRRSGRYPRDVGALRNKEVEEAIVFMDLKCIDLRKRLDVLKYGNRRRKVRLRRLGEEWREAEVRGRVRRRRRVESVRSKVVGRPVCVVENEIHRVEMKTMEAEHVRKKYGSIRVQLLSERVEFESSVRRAEEELGRQRAERRSLEVINREAVGLRKQTKGTLVRHEMSAVSGGKARESQLEELRRRVEERKLELEKLERRIFPSGRVVFEEGGEAGGGRSGGEGSEELVGELEGQLAKLRVATGGAETQEVLPRFLSQRETQQRLDFLKRMTEEEKRALEMQRELSLGELEAFKFAEVKEREESQEEVERVRLAMEREEEEREREEREAERMMEQVEWVGRRLRRLLEEWEGAEEEVAAGGSEEEGGDVGVVSRLGRRIESGLERLGAGRSLRSVEGSEEESGEASVEVGGEEAGVFPGVAPQEEGKQGKAQQACLLVAEEEEEEDVVSRAYLKRQAQLIVDAKSRKKLSRVLSLGRGRK